MVNSAIVWITAGTSFKHKAGHITKSVLSRTCKVTGKLKTSVLLLWSYPNYHYISFMLICPKHVSSFKCFITKRYPGPQTFIQKEVQILKMADLHLQLVAFYSTITFQPYFLIKMGGKKFCIFESWIRSLNIMYLSFNLYFSSCQDQIPPFPTHLARRSIESQLGVRVSQVFADISKEPIAAASLGQVYKG